MAERAHHCVGCPGACRTNELEFLEDGPIKDVLISSVLWTYGIPLSALLTVATFLPDGASLGTQAMLVFGTLLFAGLGLRRPLRRLDARIGKLLS